MKTKQKVRAGEFVLKFFMIFGLLIGFLALFSGLWYCDAYGDVGFDSVLFTLTNGVKGVGRKLALWYVLAAALPTLVCTVIASYILVFWRKERIVRFGKKIIKLIPLRKTVAAIVSFTLCVTMLISAADFTGLADHVSAQMTDGYLYDNYYVAPQDANVVFPQEKRNLIYIFLESMENTYMSQSAGGALKHDLISELAQLAGENVSFSNTDKLGGFHSTIGTTWTTGALVGITSGVHLQMPMEIDPQEYIDYYEQFLPGAYGITDLLHENGYRQMFMCGSDASFGGRREYFTQHGVDEIYDLYSAIEDELIPEDYFEWWGFEDAKLIDYAKTQLQELSQGSDPFAFYMLTCDTHFVDGYICPDCPRDENGELLYEAEYDNAIACSSRRIYAFVEWLMEQPFMENTTIVISGDHRTMDNNYMEEYVDEDYVRTQYNCIINSAVQPVKTTFRKFAPFDLYPTTLAAMGCTIENDRLALGTNLFSDKPTVMEELGSLEALNQELSYHSLYFHEKIADVYKGKEE